MFSLNVDFDTNTATVADILEEDVFDVSILEPETEKVEEVEEVDEVDEVDERTMEQLAIEDFVVVNGVTTEAPEPKESPKPKGGRGRPRKSFVKDVSFIAIIEEGSLVTGYKRAPRGRARKGQVRKSFAIHHTRLHELDTSEVYSREHLEGLASSVC